MATEADLPRAEAQLKQWCLEACNAKDRNSHCDPKRFAHKRDPVDGREEISARQRIDMEIRFPNRAWEDPA